MNQQAREDAEWSLAQIQSHIENSYPFVTEVVNKQLQAFILYVVHGEVVEICYLETLRAYRRQGLMEALLRRLIGQFPGHRIWLDVHEKNHQARGLYLKLEFQRNGLRRGYYRDGGDSLLLERVPSNG